MPENKSLNPALDIPSEEIKLSVAVITKNEADRIHRLLAGVAGADEVLIVDSGSSDGTVELCRRWGARVLHHDWQGYSDQKQFAMDSARGEWILNLDADEALSAKLGVEIAEALRTVGDDVSAFSMPRMSRYLNRWIKHGGWYPDRKVRLVRKNRGKWVGDGLHEKLEVNGTTIELKNPILHYVYRDISDQVETINRFSTVTAEYGKQSVSWLHLIWGLFHAFGKFLECAVWKLGVLDGSAGLIIAVNSAFYVFLKHAKLREKSLPKIPDCEPEI